MGADRPSALARRVMAAFVSYADEVSLADMTGEEAFEALREIGRRANLTPADAEQLRLEGLALQKQSMDA